MRTITRKNLKDRSDRAQVEKLLNEQTTKYVEEFGLPPGYQSAEELISDLDVIMNQPCGGEACVHDTELSGVVTI